MSVIVLDNFSNTNPPAEAGYDLAKIQADYKGHANASDCVKAGDTPDMSVEVKRATSSTYGTVKQLHKQIVFCCDGGGSVLTTGSKDFLQIKFAGTIQSWTLVAEGAAGTITMTIKKCAVGSYPTTTSIVASANPTIASSGVYATSSTLTGWTTSITLDDFLEFVIDAVSGITKIKLYLDVLVSN